MENSKITQTLNDLITLLKDADQGFHAAAEEVRDTKLKTELHSFGQQSATVWGELQNEVRHLGGEPVEDGTATGQCKRVWMEIKTAFTDKDETVVLKDCVKAQESVKDGFDDALKTEGLPTNIKQTITRHFNTVKEITNSVTQQRDRFESLQSS